MSITLLDVSGKLEAEVLGVFELLNSVCAARDIEFLVVGAAARDIHFLHVHGITPGRATAHVDFAHLVPSTFPRPSRTSRRPTTASV